ncbi:MAG TPA: hypothetical protein ENK43_03960 [Planctomycetes bacterium]|nr:hypothetical protein [Planctomycetota bacterium]
MRHYIKILATSKEEQTHEPPTSPSALQSGSHLYCPKFFVGGGNAILGQICTIPGANFNDDGFRSNPYNGLCCLPVTNSLSIPSFAAVTVNAEFGIVDQCSTVQKFPITLTVGPLTPLGTGCDRFQAQFSTSQNGVFVPLASGTTMELKYVRTWVEINFATSQPKRQVYRFLINGDVIFDMSANAVFPECVPVVGLPWFHGFIDYAVPVNGTGGATAMIGLTHDTGCLAHLNSPIFNAEALQPGTVGRHDEKSYHFVGPTPFIWFDQYGAPPSPLDLVVVDAKDAVRSVNDVAFPNCIEEVPMGPSVIVSDFENCLCTFGTGQDIWYHQNLAGQISCTDSGVSLTNAWYSKANLTPELPTGFAQMFLGISAAFGQYGYKQRIYSIVGFLEYADICPNTLLNGTDPNNPEVFRIVWGASTYNEGFLVSVLFEQLCEIDLTQPIQNSSEHFTRLLTDFGDSYIEDPSSPNVFHVMSGGRARTGIVWEFAQSIFE